VLCAFGSVVPIADAAAEFRRKIDQPPGEGPEGQPRAWIARLNYLETQVRDRRRQIEAQKAELQGRVSAGAGCSSEIVNRLIGLTTVLIDWIPKTSDLNSWLSPRRVLDADSRGI
jgi:hypothetical protein